MSGQPFEITAPIKNFVESRLNEKDGDEQCCEQRGKIFAQFF
jgi:hypothetical protein